MPPPRRLGEAFSGADAEERRESRAGRFDSGGLRMPSLASFTSFLGVRTS